MSFRVVGLACAAFGMAVLAACSGSESDTSGNGPETPGAITAPREGVWLSGDLHLHSDHSDDAADNPMAEIVAMAEQRGLGFFVVTDHDNHVDGAIEGTWNDPAYRSDQMVLLYGTEFTTAKGHSNMFSAKPWNHAPIYALRDGDGRELGKAAHAQGVQFSANHPSSGDPWLYGYDIGLDSIEVWNALYNFPQDQGVPISLWADLLNTGLRVTARGGSDCHHQTGIQALGYNVGNPTTWVYAKDRSAQAVLDALKEGAVSISYAPTSERIELAADRDGDGGYETLMGDNLPADGKTIRFKVTIVGYRPLLANYGVTIFKNGAVLKAYSGLAVSETISFEDTPDAGQRSYYRVEVTGTTPEAPLIATTLYGQYVGMTNPIYVGFD